MLSCNWFRLLQSKSSCRIYLSGYCTNFALVYSQDLGANCTIMVKIVDVRVIWKLQEELGVSTYILGCVNAYFSVIFLENKVLVFSSVCNLLLLCRCKPNQLRPFFPNGINRPGKIRFTLSGKFCSMDRHSRIF